MRRREREREKEWKTKALNSYFECRGCTPECLCAWQFYASRFFTSPLFLLFSFRSFRFFFFSPFTSCFFFLHSLCLCHSPTFHFHFYYNCVLSNLELVYFFLRTVYVCVSVFCFCSALLVCLVVRAHFVRSGCVHDTRSSFNLFYYTFERVLNRWNIPDYENVLLVERKREGDREKKGHKRKFKSLECITAHGTTINCNAFYAYFVCKRWRCIRHLRSFISNYSSVV